MSLNVGKLLKELRQMTLKELQQRYLEIHGEPTRSHHKDQLIRRIAWRAQALDEGDLAERAHHSTPLTVEFDVRFATSRRGRKRAIVGTPPPPPQPHLGRVPRVARLMALAVRFDQLITDGKIAGYAEIARLGHVTRARVTQIMNLLHLAPDIQDEVLHLPLVEHGRDPITERHMRPIAAAIEWRKQRRLWKELRDRAYREDGNHTLGIARRHTP